VLTLRLEFQTSVPVLGRLAPHTKLARKAIHDAALLARTARTQADPSTPCPLRRRDSG
jgi:hypothetical protein